MSHAPRTLTQPDSCWAMPPSWQAYLDRATRLFLSGASVGVIREDVPRASVKGGVLVLDESVSLSTDGEVWTAQAAVNAVRQEPTTSVAVIPVIGPVSYRSDWFSEMFGGAAVSSIANQLRRAAADPNVTVIVMPIDSPGGSVYGLQELAAQIRGARASKPVITVADPMAASAAYYIGAQGTEFVVTPSGEVGSIGVFMMHVDVSKALADEGITITFISQGKYKTEGNPYEPLSEDAAAALQTTVDHYYSQFIADVAKGRGMAKSDVLAGFGQGRMLTAPDALSAGMVDRVGTLADTLDRLVSGKWKAPEGRKALSEEPSFEAVTATIARAIALVGTPAEPVTSDELVSAGDEDGYDELARATVDEWEQSDAETRSSCAR
jgi:signal peptide peptidase SppA